uniref:Centrosomal protein 41 n=1 Tax=Piliocolobus tephrosceles TaxID=591936 RepID=A0A8C9IQC7_9PRIM
MSLRRHIGNPEYLMKRIPQNPRYQHVKSRLDTGRTVPVFPPSLVSSATKTLNSFISTHLTPNCNCDPSF